MTTDSAPDQFIARLRDICSELPESYEEPAWVGIRWRVRSKTFAHVLTIDAGWPPAYARAAGDDGLAHVLMVRSTGPSPAHCARPVTPSSRHRGGTMRLACTSPPAPTGRTDWAEITELVTESYCTQAPSRLRNPIHRRNEPC